MTSSATLHPESALRKALTWTLLVVAAAFALMLCAANVGTEQAEAAALPSVSSSKYIMCYTKASSGKVRAYHDAALTRPTGGWIDCATDDCRIIAWQSGSVRVTYPVKNHTAWKTAWFTMGAFTNRNLYTQGSDRIYMYTGNGVTVYKRRGSTAASNRLGTATKGDYLYLTEGNIASGWAQVIYNVGSVKAPKYYKMGYIYNGSTISPSKANSLASKAESQIGYYGPKDNTKYGSWIGANYRPWCASYVSWCCNAVGVSTSVVPKTASTLTMAQRSNSYRAMTATSFSQLKRGDVIFFSTTTGLTYKGAKRVHHVGIVSAVNKGTKQVSITEGNTSKDVVKKNTYTIDPANSGKITKGYNGHYLCGYISVN